MICFFNNFNKIKFLYQYIKEKSAMSYYLSLTEAPVDPPVWLVCLLGVGVVFIGLILMVGILSLMNLIFSKILPPAKKTEHAPVTQSVNKTPIENKQEILAAVCVAVAEENGTDISAIRVLSFKKIN